MWNRCIVIIILSFVSITTYANNDQKIIEKANKLINNKKYESAFNKLEQYDPQNKKLEIFLKKYEIVSKYALSSKQHRAFVLKDLKKNETIKSVVVNIDQAVFHSIYVDLIFDSLLKVDPGNCKLNKLAAEHLFDVHLKFGTNWIKPEGEYLKEMAIYSEKAINGKCADEQDYYKIGYYLLNVGKYKESIYFFYQSILKNEKNASSHYNLAFAYIMTKSPVSALTHAKKAFQLYSDSLYKSDASRMLAEAYFQNNQVDSAIMFYEEAEKLDSTTINNIASLLNIYLKTSKVEKAEECFMKIYKIDPVNPAIYNELEQIFANNNLEKELIKKYESLLKVYSENTEIIANLKYYLARLYSIENTEKAINTYLESRTYFEKIYKSDHPVFASIDKSIEQLNDNTK